MASLASTSTASAAGGARLAGGRPELLGECAALVQRDRHEQAAARTLAAVGERHRRQGSVGAAQTGDGSLVQRDPRHA